MGARFVATAQADTFTNTHHTVEYQYGGDGRIALEPDGDVVNIFGPSDEPSDPYNGIIEGLQGSDSSDEFLGVIAGRDRAGVYIFEVFDDNSVDYSPSNDGVFVDLERPTQQGGYAQGDVLIDVSEVIGSVFDDVIRGSNTSDYPPDAVKLVGKNLVFTTTLLNPGENFLIGGNGSDVLEGRGGADILVGGSFNSDFGFDYASYESSPSAVTVRLKGVGSDTQTAIANGGDATGDTLVGIEGLIGSRFNDTLTGNSLNNVLAGGLGDDILDGRGGIDTVDYSRDHFFDSVGAGNTADRVDVRLGINGASGIGAEFRLNLPDNFFTRISTDTLVSIENVTGTAGSDTIVGNEQDNVLDGRGGNDLVDGGFGNDTLIGGSGINTASFVSHDAGVVPIGETNTISLGNNGADGSYTRSHVVFTLPVHSVVDETDILRGFQDVQGSNRAETINGNEQNNVLDGRGGGDVLDGGLGNDTLIGGEGIDTASYVSHDGLALALGVTIRLGAGTADGSATATILSTHQIEADILRGIENVIGSSHDDTINGNEQDNVLDGRGGNDTLDGGLGNDTLIGGAGDNTALFASHDSVPLVIGARDVISLGLNGADGSYTRLQPALPQPTLEHDVLRGIADVIGSNHDETINGNENSNGLTGRGGNDNLNGGAGGDVYFYLGSAGVAFGNDRIFDDSGTDAIVVNSFSDIVGAPQHVGDDLLITLTGGTIRILEHFAGHQVENIFDANGNSMVLATGLIGGNAPGIIAGGNGGETLDGKGGDDFLFGNRGNDILLGGDGNDRLDGGAGSDILDGGTGNDILTGGHGRDTFVFAPMVQNGLAPGNDVVTDFKQGRDLIDLTAFNTTFRALDDNHNGTLDAGEGDKHIGVQVHGGDTVLSFAGGSIRIEDVTHLHANDFLL
jgi:Ca2+-binding RTX toxin-like protein